MQPSGSRPWFAGGLRFSCMRCGRCCTGEPGYVWLTPKDIRAISTFLGTNRVDFLKNYCRNVGGRISLIEYGNGDCVFYRADSGCAVYPSRPLQCRRFPFWPQLLKSPHAWEKEKARCPGIGRGKIHTQSEIRKLIPFSSFCCRLYISVHLWFSRFRLLPLQSNPVSASYPSCFRA